MHHDRKNYWNARMAGAASAAFAVLANAALAHAPRVLRVGTYHGHKGAYATIQSAVNAAAPGDWILVGPGDYHERGNPQAGVWVTTPGIHLRGMDRNAVIVDGTNAGSSPCSADPAVQNFGIGFLHRRLPGLQCDPAIRACAEQRAGVLGIE